MGKNLSMLAVKISHTRVLTTLVATLVTLLFVSTNASAGPRGLNQGAFDELTESGVFKYLDQFSPVSSEGSGDGWTKHTFDSDDGNGPICITGTDYSVYSREGNSKKLLVFLQGGGACWQGFYNCNFLAEDQAPPPVGPYPGVFDASNRDNPFRDYSVVYMPYCDGSGFGGDNDIADAGWESATGSPLRYQRGVRNVSAGMDVAGKLFPKAKKVTVMGHSAGGVGVAAFAPFLARYVFGNKTQLTVYNDAGPIAVNLGAEGTTPGQGDAPFFGCIDSAGLLDFSCVSVLFRANDWQFAKFYPASCIESGRCNAFGQQTGIIDWRLENDVTIREAFYETDSDGTNRFFAQGDGTLMDPQLYRELILTEHGALHDAYPGRYKRFIVSADDTHGAVQTTASSNCFPEAQPLLFYTQKANGRSLNEWTAAFIKVSRRPTKQGWKDIVEDYVSVEDC